LEIGGGSGKAETRTCRYLEALLSAELEERERHVVARRITEAKFPKVKTLEDFHFEEAPIIPSVVGPDPLPSRRLRSGNWPKGEYLRRNEPIIFLGDTGTGKTHLATGLAVEACRQRKRVRFTTAPELVNELIEAKNKSELSRVRNRWLRYQLIVIDEMTYVSVLGASGGAAVSGYFPEPSALDPSFRSSHVIGGATPGAPSRPKRPCQKVVGVSV
jgi:DNA replication protein DnaC